MSMKRSADSGSPYLRAMFAAYGWICGILLGVPALLMSIVDPSASGGILMTVASFVVPCVLTGARASCEDFGRGADADEVLLPLVEPSVGGDAGQVLHRDRCSLEGCRREAWAMPVRIDANDAGELRRRE